MSQCELGSLIANALPTNVKVTARHVSSTPTPCAALFAPPPGETSEATYCENHFLVVSATVCDGDGHGPEREVIVFGVEVLVYSTAHLTTVFVSKADSTGYLHLLKNAPKASLLRHISTAFLGHLIETRQRPGVRLVLSLFARAQNQYLFPGSIEYTGKHVLDDRALIKWWCRVVDPILRQREPESISRDKDSLEQSKESAKSSATGFLIVPGCDKFETRSFFPTTTKSDSRDHPRWVNDYPLWQLCANPKAPSRCLVPRFPDDPKTRFLIDLDDEISEPEPDAAGGIANGGQWRSVKTLDQFWEMMSFRQECSAGRLVGFLWLVINPPGLVNSTSMETNSHRDEASHAAEKVNNNPIHRKAKASSVLTCPSQETPTPNDQDNPFTWPESGRGHIVLSDQDYKTAVDFFLQQDFADYNVATASTKAWVDKVASLADELWFGEVVVGNKTISLNASGLPETTNNLLDAGLIRKRKKLTQGEHDNAAADPEEKKTDGEGRTEPVSSQEPPVNVLGGGLIRKKKKT